MFEFDRNGFMEIIEGIMGAQKGTLAYQARNEWALFAVEMNVDKLYESVE